MEEGNYDVLIIGGGVVGCAIARELSRYDLKTAVIEKELDVGLGASCRNSGVIHSGIHYKPGTNRAKYCVKGNEMMAQLCKELKVKYNYIGKLTVALDEDDIPILERLMKQGTANGVPGLEMLDYEGMQKHQPGVGGVKALYSPTSGIVSPYGLTIALAENAHMNGAVFHLGREVASIEKSEGGFAVKTDKGDVFRSKVIINSAGVHSDKICRMLGIDEYRIYPCRGEYYVLDKRLKDSLNLLVYPAPHKGKGGLGIHLTNTPDGPILIGPSNEYIEDGEDFACTSEIMQALKKEGHDLLPDLSAADFIRSYSGIRAKLAPPGVGGFLDFVIEDREDIPGFINLVGIESPGLTGAPAIAVDVAAMVGGHIDLDVKTSFNSEMPGHAKHFSDMSADEKAKLVAEDPDYGEIVCRCEQITKKEIIDAIRNPLGARTLVGIKYRSRAMMGRCQGGFCTPKIIKIMEEELGMAPEEFLLKSKRSHLFSGKVRDGDCDE